MEKNCKTLVSGACKGRLADLRTLWSAHCNPGTEYATEDGNVIGGDLDGAHLYEYGLSFDYVTPGTFNGQRRGYFRYQISWGGPSEEFRFFCDENLNPVRVEFWYLDWFDGAKKILAGDDLELMLDLFRDWKDCGTVQSEFEKGNAE